MINVVDHRSNPQENVVNAASFIGTSWWKREVFREVYRGRRKAKTAQDIADRMGVKVKRVLETGVQLRKAGLVHQPPGRPITYEKEDFLDQNKARILRLAVNKKVRERVPTKSNPKTPKASTVRVRVWGKPYDIQEVTIDDIASFAKIRRIRAAKGKRLALPEKAFKEGVKKIIGETGRFVDWPGEKFDVLSTRVKLKRTRIRTAFAFKGPGKKGILMPLDMGRRGDQIQRLFHSEAQVFIVQYWGQVDESVIELMRTFALARSLYHAGRPVYYGVIDGEDSDRLVLAYPRAFPKPKAT